MMNLDNTKRAGEPVGILSNSQPKLHQVRIQLPLVNSATQTLNDSGTQTDDWFSPGPFDTFSSSSPYKSPYPGHAGHEAFNIQTSGTVMADNSNSVMGAKSQSNGGREEYENRDALVRFSLIKKKSELSSYLIALRPWSFTASIIPVALGSCLAYKSQGVFDIYIFITTVLTALCVHAAGNLVNTYFDFVRGIDNKKSDDRTLVDDILKPNDVATLGAIFYIVGCAGFMLLNVLSSAKMEHLALIYFCGLSSSFLYTGGLGLKYIALGDILIVLTFGPLTVVFSHLSQTGQLSLVPLIYAIPLALNTEAILHSNNTRDMDSDRQAGVMTLAILLGKTGSYCLFCFLLFVPYLLFVTVGIHYSSWILLPAATIFLVFELEKNFRRGNFVGMPQQVAKLNLLMGVVYILALFLADPKSLPSMTPLAP